MRELVKLLGCEDPEGEERGGEGRADGAGCEAHEGGEGEGEGGDFQGEGGVFGRHFCCFLVWDISEVGLLVEGCCRWCSIRYACLLCKCLIIL